MELPYEEADRQALEQEMLQMARESFLALWERYERPKTLARLDFLYPPATSNMSAGHRRVLTVGIKLDWHKGAA